MSFITTMSYDSDNFIGGNFVEVGPSRSPNLDHLKGLMASSTPKNTTESAAPKSAVPKAASASKAAEGSLADALALASAVVKTIEDSQNATPKSKAVAPKAAAPEAPTVSPKAAAPQAVAPTVTPTPQNPTTPTAPADSTPVTGYQPEKYQNQWAENILNSSVEQTSFVLIILVCVIYIGMAMPTLQTNDLTNESEAIAPIVSDLNTINSELTKLQSAISPTAYPVTVDGQTVDVNINPQIFTESDFKTLSNAFSDLFMSDGTYDPSNPESATGNPPIGNLNIEVNGQKYYPKQDGTWTTTPPTSTGSYCMQSADTPASDVQMYMFANAAYQVDMDDYYGTSVDTAKVFPSSESQITDPNMLALNSMWTLFNGSYSSDSTYNAKPLSSLMFEYSAGTLSSTDALALVHQVGGLADNYLSSQSDGQPSVLGNMISSVNGVTTQFNNVSQQETNTISQDMQTLNSYNSIGTTVISDASKMMQSFIGAEKVA